jgi:hypothetical protein
MKTASYFVYGSLWINSFTLFLGCANKTSESSKVLLNEKGVVEEKQNVETQQSDTIRRSFFAVKYLQRYEEKILHTIKNDSLIYQHEISNDVNIFAYQNDSLNYLVYYNKSTKAKKVLFISEASNKISLFGRFSGEVGNSFVWTFGSSSSNPNWIVFDVQTGKFLVSGGGYLGSCIEKKMLFFMFKNSILAYTPTTDYVSVVVDFSKRSKKYQRFRGSWDIGCERDEIVLKYREDFQETIRVRL